MPGYYDRSVAILYVPYSLAFMAKAVESGHSQLLFEPGDTSPLADKARTDYELYYRRSPHKSAALQALLIFDKLVLVMPTTACTYDRLRASGLVEFKTLTTDPSLLAPLTWDEPTKEYVTFLKPIVIKALSRTMSQKDREMLRHPAYGPLTPNSLYSTMFEYLVLPSAAVQSPSYPWVYSFLQDWAHVQYYESGWHPRPPQGANREEVIDYLKGTWARRIMECAHELMSLLEYSVTMDAVLLQRAYPLPAAACPGVGPENMNESQLLKSYQILRVSMEQAIGSLPALDSIDDVLRLKEKRQRDIVRLRSVLNEIEDALRHGRKEVLKEAERAVRQASEDLSKGTRLMRVSKWTTYLALSIGVLETYLQSPPIASFINGVVGAVATLGSEITQRRATWVQIVR